MTNVYELWYRAIYLCSGLLCCMLVVSCYMSWYLPWLVLSLQTCAEIESLLCTEMYEGLFVSFFGSFLFASLYFYPLCLYSVWAFLMPGLRVSERRSYTQILILTLGLQGVLVLGWFMGGNRLLWSLLLQYMESDSLVLQPKALSFVTFHGSVFSGIFLLGLFPGLLHLCIHVFGLSQSHIARLRTPVLAVCCLLSAWITPGDVISQALCTTLSWLLFETSLFTLFLLCPSRLCGPQGP